MAHATLLDVIAYVFIESAKRDGFNGVAAYTLLKFEADPDRLRDELLALIRDGEITAVFSRLSVNMHIKRLPDLSIEKQVQLLGD